MPLPLIVIAQHMGEWLVPNFASHLEKLSKCSVTTVGTETPVVTQGIYICTCSCALTAHAGRINLKPEREHPSIYNPSVDLLFTSACTLAEKSPGVQPLRQHTDTG